MSMRRVLGCCLVVLLAAVTVGAASSEVADAAMKGNREAVRSLLQRKADVNARRSTAPRRSIGRCVWTTWKWRTC